jgi:hypothetical protein
MNNKYNLLILGIILVISVSNLSLAITWTEGTNITTSGQYEMFCNNTIVSAFKQHTINNMSIWNLSGSNVYNYAGFDSQTSNGKVGGFMNNSDSWVIHPNQTVSYHNLVSGGEKREFDGAGWSSASPADVATGIVSDINGVDGIPSWFLVIFNNGTLINYSSAWVQSGAWNLTAIIAPSYALASPFNNWRGLAYHNGNTFIGWNGDTDNGTSQIFHLDSSMANVTDGFNVSGGALYQLCMNTNGTLFVEHSLNSKNLVSPYFQSPYLTSSLVSPANNTNNTELTTLNFTCNSLAYSTQLKSITLKIYNPSGTLNYSNTKDISGTLNQTSWNRLIMNNGSYLWNCQINNSDNSFTDWDVNRTINIDQISLNNCTTWATPTLNFSFIDEQNSSKINGTIESTFIFYKDSINYNRSYAVSMSNGNNTYLYCINPAYISLYTNANIRYYADSGGYSSRYYNFDNLTINNQTKQIWLRLLENSSTRKFFINVRNVDDTVVRSAVVNIYKFYESTGQYNLVASGRTDYYGEFTTWLEEDRNHLFAVYVNGTNVKNQTSTTKCTEIPCTISLKIGPDSSAPFAPIQDIPGFSFTLEYNKLTGNVSLAYTSNAGTISNVILTLKQLKQATADIIPCNRTSTADVASLGCDISNVTTGQFAAYAYITTNEGKMYVRYISISVDNRFQTFGNEGVFWAIGLLLVIVFTGLWNPSVAIALTLVSFGLLASIGIIAVSYTIVIVLVIIGFIYLVMMRT